jgi:diguanylate cyclase (GGDEF)-like protein/PAS domain S-box-containing protein
MKSLALEQIRTRVESLEQEIKLQKTILEVIQEPIFVLNRKREFLKTNSKGLEVLGRPWEELREMAFTDLVASEDLPKTREGFEEMEQGKEVRFRTHLVGRSGEQIPLEFFGTIREEAAFVSLMDLREKIEAEREWEKTKKELMEKIRERDQYARELQVAKELYREKLDEIEKMGEDARLLSYIDDLTGAYNHRFFIEQLTREVERQKRYPSPPSLLMIDIDYFKQYNDTNGHLAGDEALRAIAILIRRGVRQTDIVARYGGEEFSAILINTGKQGAREIAERVRRKVAEISFPNEKAQPSGDVTVSIGVATFSPFGPTLTDLIREADNALYRAKKAGRNRVEG